MKIPKSSSVLAQPSSSVTSLTKLSSVSTEMNRAVHRRNRLNGVLGLPDAGAGVVENEAIEKVRAEAIFHTPASNLTWAQMTDLAKIAPQLAEQKWGAIQQTASDELRTGHRSARMNQSVNATPIERARHLALSEELRRNFQPRGGIEEVLLQNLVQAQSQYEFWLSTFVSLNSFGIQRPNDDLDPLESPRLTEAEALENAMMMIERWNRMFLRCLRALKEWRRQPSIVANQVNIAGQQVVSQSNE